MADPLFIYPQWYRARRDLIEALGLTQKQIEILGEWMRAHVFEFGIDHKISNVLYEKAKNPKDILNAIRYQNSRSLCGSIMNKGLFLEEVSEGAWFTNVRTTILVCGVPSIVGPAQR